MNTFHLITQKILMLLFAFSFVFVSVYVPQPVNKIDKAEAFFGGEATSFNQLMQHGVAAAQLVQDTIIAGFQAALHYKELVLDGIFWVLARVIISQMTADIVNWINRGFEGSPMFVQDIRRYTLEIADKLMGSYLQQIGGLASMVCAPFRLDIQLAMQFIYSQARRGHIYGTCTLSGALTNIENFFRGSGAFFDGGWDAWYGVTSRPAIYSPYGELLEVQSQAAIRIINAQGNEMGMVAFGDGFMSKKICEVIFWADSAREECVVSSPGEVIAKTLNFQLSAGGRSLIAADEINEIIGALFAQLAVQALDGTAGLLGLTGDSGYTQPLTEADLAGSVEGSEAFVGETFADGVGLEQELISDLAIEEATREEIQRAIEIEERYLAEANNYLPGLEELSGLGGAFVEGTLLVEPNPADLAAAAVEEINGETIPQITENIALLNGLLARLDGDEEPELVYNDFDAIRRAEVIMPRTNGIIEEPIAPAPPPEPQTTFHEEGDIEDSKLYWDSILGAAYNPYYEMQTTLMREVTEQLAQLEEKCLYDEAVEARRVIAEDVRPNIEQLETVRSRALSGDIIGAVGQFVGMLPPGGTLHTEEEANEIINEWVDTAAQLNEC